MPLATLQRLLEGIYDLSGLPALQPFVLSDPKLAHALAGSTVLGQEALLLREHADGMDISLYLHPSLLERLHQDDPSKRLHPGNLHDFWLALEGVSHFLRVTWAAHQRRAVTQVDLELQAEVDKFVAARELARRQADDSWARHLFAWLFRDWRLRAGLSNEQRGRYQRASLAAQRYCQTLQGQGIGRDPQRQRRELRRFYRDTRARRLAA